MVKIFSVNNFSMTSWVAKNLGFVAHAVVCLAVSNEVALGKVLGRQTEFSVSPNFMPEKLKWQRV